MNFTRYIDEVISIAAGVWAVLLGYRILGKRPGTSLKYDEWHARYRVMLRFAGFGLIGLGIVRMCLIAPATQVEGKADRPLDWQKIATTDGVVTLDMPGKPEVRTQTEQREAGEARLIKYHLSIHGGTIDLSLNEAHPPEAIPPGDREQILDLMLQDGMVKSNGKVLGEREIDQEGIVGKEVTIGFPKGQAGKMRYFAVGDSFYQIRAVMPDSMAGSEVIARFFDSIRIARPRK